MHYVLSGPYEVLYTTSVDIWSFGCLLLTIFIGKSGPLKQRGVCYKITLFIGLRKLHNNKGESQPSTDFTKHIA